MIKNFRDHAANERTFLAWVRTAIAIMAFGFIVEKFGLFLELAAPSLANRTLAPGAGCVCLTGRSTRISRRTTSRFNRTGRRRN